MTNEEFREEIRAVLRRHDPNAEELRSLAAALEARAARYDENERWI